jgi:hypothetical protein
MGYWVVAVGCLFVVLMLMLALPVPRTRRIALVCVEALLSLVMVLNVVAGAVLTVCPKVAPAALEELSNSQLAKLREDYPLFDAVESKIGCTWLLLAGATVLGGLPLFRYLRENRLALDAEAPEKTCPEVQEPPAEGRPEPPLVRVELLGREGVGKTVLLLQMYLRLFDARLSSGLGFVPADAQIARHIDRLEREQLYHLRHDGCPTTVRPEILELILAENEEPVARVAIGDAVGQVYHETAGEKPVHLTKRRDQQMTRIARADVLLQVIACPADLPGSGVHALRDSWLVTAAHVREALAERTRKTPVALVVCLSQMDLLCPTVNSTEEKVARGVLQWLARRTRDLARSSRVRSAFVVPVSALGFGTARQGKSRAGASSPLAANEYPNPWNLTTLGLVLTAGGLLSRGEAERARILLEEAHVRNGVLIRAK